MIYIPGHKVILTDTGVTIDGHPITVVNNYVEIYTTGDHTPDTQVADMEGPTEYPQRPALPPPLATNPPPLPHVPHPHHPSGTPPTQATTPRNPCGTRLYMLCAIVWLVVRECEHCTQHNKAR